MPDWDKILAQVAAVSNAPIPFFVALLVVACFIWWAIDWKYSAVTTHRDAEIARLKGERDEYKTKLSGATPDQAKDKIETLERTLRMTLGVKWEPLSRAEIDLLASKIKLVPKARIQITYVNSLGKELAQSLYDAFITAEWEGAQLLPGAGFGEGVHLGRGSRATALQAAIQSSSKISVIVEDADHEGALFLGIGINASAQ